MFDTDTPPLDTLVAFQKIRDWSELSVRIINCICIQKSAQLKSINATHGDLAFLNCVTWNCVCRRASLYIYFFGNGRYDV